MKPKILFLSAFFISLFTFAQQGINYKAALKDASGNPLATTLTVTFTMHSTSATGTVVYSEQHTGVTPDANGIIIVTIGTGTPTTGTFSTIDWSVNYFLNTTITYGTPPVTTTVDLGTTQFMTVPYTKHAETATTAMTATTAANVTGLETLDEGSGMGWRLKGRNPANYGTIGLDAVDLSLSATASTTRGATGASSTAMGTNTTASGFASTAMGVNTTASGNYSTAMGFSTISSGLYSTAMGNYTTSSGSVSTAMGYRTTASGIESTAMGISTTASSYASTTMGRGNVGGGNAATWVATDPLLEVGNGTLSTPSNALTILKW